jgi:hypothetical protein
MLHAPRRSAALSVLAFALLLQAPALGKTGSGFEGRVSVLRGRAVLVDEDGSRRLLGTAEDFQAPEKAHLELGAGAEARLTWTGQASLRLWGPASIDWQPWIPRVKSADREPGLAWRVTELAWADLEVRRGVHRIELPGNWSARVEQSAIHLRSLPWGPIEVRHHAGSVLQMLWSGDPHHVRPPLTIYPGSSLRLDQPPEGAEDVTRHARAWDLPTWPWSRRTDSVEQAGERPRLADISDRQARGPESWPVSRDTREQARQFQDRRNLYTEILSEDPEQKPEASGAHDPVDPEMELPISTPPAASPKPNLEAGANRPRPSQGGGDDKGSADDGTPKEDTSRSSLAPEQPQPVRVDPAPRTGEARPTHETVPTLPSDSKRWRGLSPAQRTLAGNVWVQRASGVEIRASKDDQWKVLVDSSAQSPIWCLGPRRDLRLQPGSIVVFDAEGVVRSSYGEVETLPLPKTSE